MKLLGIRKVLMRGGVIRLGNHAQQRMKKRGYSKGDIVQAILNGQLTEIQYGYVHEYNKITFKYVIEGLDMSDNPIVVIVAEGDADNTYLVKTVMPLLDKRRFKKCI